MKEEIMVEVSLNVYEALAHICWEYETVEIAELIQTLVQAKASWELECSLAIFLLERFVEDAEAVSPVDFTETERTQLQQIIGLAKRIEASL